jgi:hypothetical protein
MIIDSDTSLGFVAGGHSPSFVCKLDRYSVKTLLVCQAVDVKEEAMFSLCASCFYMLAKNTVFPEPRAPSITTS